MSWQGGNDGAAAALAAARERLAEAVQGGREAVRHAREVSGRSRPARLSGEDIRRIDRAAGGRDSPPELRQLAQRVRRGELSWRQIVDGEAMHDPGVQAAMRANLARLGRMYRKFEEGHPLGEVLESEGVPARPARGGLPVEPGGGGSAGDWETGGEPVLRRSSW